METTIWKYGITGGLVLVFLIVGSCQATKYHIRKAIESGAKPLSAKCALTMGDSREVCAIIAAAEARGI